MSFALQYRQFNYFTERKTPWERSSINPTFRTFQDRYMATVIGDIEDVNGVLKIVRIHVLYNLKLPADKRTDAEEAFNNYITLCPAAQSVVEAIKITHELEMTDDKAEESCRALGYEPPIICTPQELTKEV